MRICVDCPVSATCPRTTEARVNNVGYATMPPRTRAERLGRGLPSIEPVGGVHDGAHCALNR